VPGSKDPGTEAELSGLQGIIQASQASVDIGYLGGDGLQALACFACRRVHILVYHFHQLTKVILGKDAFLDLVYHQFLELLTVKIGSLAGAGSLLKEASADVIAEPAALGFLAYKRPAAVPAVGQAAEEVAAGRPWLS